MPGQMGIHKWPVFSISKRPAVVCKYRALTFILIHLQADYSTDENNFYLMSTLDLSLKIESF
jgi:hypothetical protein